MLKMINDEISKQLVWRDSREARVTCFSPLFGVNVEIEILSTQGERISARSLRVINDFLELTPAQLEKIKHYLWEDCKLNCEVSSYGFDVPDDKEETQVNHEEFGVHNPDDAFEKSSPPDLLIIEDDQISYEGNFGHLTFDNEWNSSLTTIVMSNGEIVGYGDSGVNLGRFEPAV
jgi:hypothetical protein